MANNVIKDNEKKLCIIVGLLVVVTLLCLSTFIILIIMYTTLSINMEGMHSLAFFKDSRNIRWFVEGDFNHVVLHDSTVNGFDDQSLVFKGDNQNIGMSVRNILQSSMTIKPNGTFIKTNHFKFVNPFSKSVILDINGGNKIKMNADIRGKKLKINAVKTPRVVSDHTDDLQLRSSSRLILTGNEGVIADGKTINIQANQDIRFSMNDQRHEFMLNKDGEGIQLAPSKLLDTTSDAQIESDIEKYRLCYCVQTGLLYRARMTSDLMTCAVAIADPCK